MIGFNGDGDLPILQQPVAKSKKIVQTLSAQFNNRVKCPTMSGKFVARTILPTASGKSHG
jgi:hypothetical protein